ncbi:styrene monooxygenase/indole monooxygenase family protein [Kibdelosporangium aridum]|uniref:styrene monooxygenase/indole monooxygenase family protein n=1 Tax=Kibdelosporangium aridum TaxID=2030 RepID=UPI0021AE0815|nr:styrene monooxygenase/indole monooxygenase family protein [Kibdelosporangium aridum]
MGAGQAGMLLALGLQQHGYEITVVTERDADTIRTGRVLSNQCMFDNALRFERQQGLNFWDDRAPTVDGVAFRAAAGIQWESPLDNPGQSVDQRLKMSDWLTEFADRGGEIRLQRVGPDDLEELAREFELVLVAAGRGPQFAKLFARNDELSPFTEPQRAISLLYLKTTGQEYQGVAFALGPDGEFFHLPLLSVDGVRCGIYFSGIPGGPLDCWDVADAEDFFERAEKALQRHFPWLAPIMADAEPGGPLDFLTGRITPVVRDPVGTLDSGAKVLAMGDTAVTNDPIAGQGANMAAHCAAAYQKTILEQGDKPFDEQFMRLGFQRFWETGQHATRFSNDLLRPPPAHVLATLATAQQVPEVAHRFAQLFNDPTDYTGWLTDEQAAMHYIQEATAR